MLLIGFKNITTGTGTSENDYSQVEHQRTDIIAGSPFDTTETLAELYHAMTRKAEQSKKKLIELNDKLDYQAFSGHCEIGADEYDELVAKYSDDMRILEYQRVIIVEGIILK